MYRVEPAVTPDETNDEKIRRLNSVINNQIAESIFYFNQAQIKLAKNS